MTFLTCDVMPNYYLKYQYVNNFDIFGTVPLFAKLLFIIFWNFEANYVQMNNKYISDG